MKRDVAKNVFNLLIILFSVTVYFLIPYQTSDSNISYVASSAFPTLLCQVLFVVAMINAIHEFYTVKVTEKVKTKLISVQAITIYLIMLISVIAISYIGFNIAMIAGSILILISLKMKKLYAYALIPVIVYLISLVFSNMLYIDLPTGAF